MALRSSVGASATCTSRANETMPTFAVFGQAVDEILCRGCARPAIRLGWTSVAAIEFDVSTVSTTVVCFWSLAIIAWGLAAPTSSRPRASSSSAGGT